MSPSEDPPPPPVPMRPPGLVARVLVWLTAAYKAMVSPFLPPACRFTPTCSEYARQALLKHGALRGTGLALWRICRCHPFCEGGHDPVP